MSITYSREDFGINYPDSDVLMELIDGVIKDNEITWTKGKILQVYEPLMLHKKLEEDIDVYTKYMNVRVFILAHIRGGKYVTGEIFKRNGLKELLFPHMISTFVYNTKMKYQDMIKDFNNSDIVYQRVDEENAKVRGLSYVGFGYLLADRLNREGIIFDDVSMFSVRNNTSTDLYFD